MTRLAPKASFHPGHLAVINLMIVTEKVQKTM